MIDKKNLKGKMYCGYLAWETMFTIFKMNLEFLFPSISCMFMYDVDCHNPGKINNMTEDYTNISRHRTILLIGPWVHHSKQFFQ